MTREKAVDIDPTPADPGSVEMAGEPAAASVTPPRSGGTTMTRSPVALLWRSVRVIDAYRVAGVALAILVWQLASMAIGEVTLPGPGKTLAYINDNFFESAYLVSHGLGSGGGYVPHLVYTSQNVIGGVLVGTAIGTTLGLLSIRTPVIGEIVTPIAATFGTAPIVVAAPFFLLWFGIVAFGQFLIVAFYTSLLMYIFSRRAGDNVQPHFIESALTLGTNPGTVFRHIYVPATIPEITAGFRIALAGSWGLAAVAELLGSQLGAGFLIKFYASAFVVEGMFALTLLLGLIAVGFDRLAVFGFRYLTRWSESGHQLEL